MAWRWSPPPPAAAAATLEWNFTVPHVAKYLGVLVISTDLTFGAHIEKNVQRATSELAAARSAVTIFGSVRRVHALVAYVAYGRAHVEWAAPVYGALSAAARGQLERLHDATMALAAEVGGDVATFLLGEMLVAPCYAAAAVRFAFDLATAAEAFSRRGPASRYVV
jgi:precorrin-4 methylase